MYKVISKSRLIQTVTIVNDRGNTVAACIPPKGFVLSRVITKSIQDAVDRRAVVIKNTAASINSTVSTIISDQRAQDAIGSDSGSFGETMSITEIPAEDNNSSTEGIVENVIESEPTIISDETTEDSNSSENEINEDSSDQSEEESPVVEGSNNSEESEESSENDEQLVDLQSLKKSELVAYAKERFGDDVQLEESWKKDDLISKIEELQKSGVEE